MDWTPKKRPCLIAFSFFFSNSGGMVHEDDDENGPFEFVWFGDYIFAFIGCIVLFIVIKRRQGILRQRQLEQSRQRQQNSILTFFFILSIVLFPSYLPAAAAVTYFIKLASTILMASIHSRDNTV